MNTIKIIVMVTISMIVTALPYLAVGQTNSIVEAIPTSTVITITSPTINSEFIRGNSYTIKWESNPPSRFGAKVSLTTPLGDNGFTCPGLMISGNSLFTNSITWVAPTNTITSDGLIFIPDGVYQINIIPVDDAGQVRYMDQRFYHFHLSSKSLLSEK